MNNTTHNARRRRFLQAVAAAPALPALTGTAAVQAAPTPRPSLSADGVDHALGNHPQYAAPMGFGRGAESPDGTAQPIDPQLRG